MDTPATVRPALLVEQIMPDRIETSPLHRDITRRDLTMLVGPGGRERTAAEFCELLAAGGFARRGVAAVRLGFSMIEAAPV